MKMKKLALISVRSLACISLLWMSRAYSAANDDAEIRQLLDRWKKAFEAKDLNGIMSIYEPGSGRLRHRAAAAIQRF
jgi:hypothetical protein